jgi:hypothetical protein
MMLQFHLEGGGRDLIQLTKGTIEHLPVNVRDRLGNLATLDGVTTTYLVRKESDKTNAITETNASTIGMTAFCLIDTTTLAQDRYELLLRLAIGSEIPLLGPFDFEVI